jgi:hypothetical protein
MRSYFITFRSITYAQRAERILKDAGIRCTLQRAPRAMEERGCGYAIHLRQADISTALLLLRRAQVPMRKVYARDESGKVEEEAL